MNITTYNIYSKLFLLLYADDTVIIAENQSELQKTLENIHEYCITNLLTINTTKTRVIVCSCGKIRNKPTFRPFIFISLFLKNWKKIKIHFKTFFICADPKF